MRFLATLFGLILLPGIASAACKAPGHYEGELRHGKLDREYTVHVPKAAAAGKPLPLLIAMHGGWGTGGQFADQSGFDSIAERRGFIVVYPEGWRRSWNAGRCCGPASEKKVDDVGFIAALAEKLKGEYCVDPARVYGTGFSNGAMLAHRIACEKPEVFAAIATVSGGIMVDACPAKRATPALLLQGKLDERIPWDGGVFDGTYRPAMREVVSSLAQRNGCAASEQAVTVGGAPCTRLSQCSSGAAITWCGIERTGHQWPGGQTVWPRLLGPNNGAFNASERIWSYFEQIKAR